jgi:hypothetical protein
VIGPTIPSLSPALPGGSPWAANLGFGGAMPQLAAPAASPAPPQVAPSMASAALGGAATGGGAGGVAAPGGGSDVNSAAMGQAFAHLAQTVNPKLAAVPPLQSMFPNGLLHRLGGLGM